MASQTAPASGPLQGSIDGWRLPLGMLILAVAVLVLLSWDSVDHMMKTWSRLSAYNHCWMILPIAGFLAWERRDRMIALRPEPFWPALILLAGFSFIWVIARGAAIMEGQQIAIIGMIQSLILTILGRKIFRAQIFPILYLWLLVPTGGFLLPTLQWIATKITMVLLSLTPIPFFIEGFYIDLPVGSFFVAPGCGGLNFLLAALALSIVYADIMYSGWKRKLACISIWLAISILANGIRIFIILVLAQISDKKLAIVDDHILYGWGFFILIVFGLMAIGKNFSNYVPKAPCTSYAAPLPPPRQSALLLIGLAAIVIMAAPLAYARIALEKIQQVAELAIEMPVMAGAWKLSEKMSLWDGAFHNADISGYWRYYTETIPVDLAVGYYWDQWEGHEATAGVNNLYGPSSAHVLRSFTAKAVVNGAERKVNARLIRIASVEYVVWNWFCSGNYLTARSSVVQARAAMDKLLLREAPATVFTLVTPEGGGAQDRLQDFLSQFTSGVDQLGIKQIAGNKTRNAACW